MRVLFVCAMNKQRSATAEQIYRNDPRVEARSAGVRFGAKRCLSEADLRWAEVVFVMERDQKTWIAERFLGLQLPPIEVLDIPDEYEFMDPQLEQILRMLVDPEIEARLGRH